MDDSNKSKLIKNYTFTVVKYFGTCLKLRIWIIFHDTQAYICLQSKPRWKLFQMLA
jgi:hypothetical protein